MKLGEHPEILVRRTSADVWATTACTALLVVAAATLSIISPGHWTSGSSLVWGLVALGFAGLTVVVHLGTRADAVRLTSGRIERQGLFGARSRRIVDIVGARSGSDGVFLIGREGVAPLSIPRYAGKDPAFLAWVNSLPNLDYEEAVALEARLEQDTRLGSSTAERQSTLICLRKIAWGLTWVTIAVVLWGFAFPVHYDVLLLALGGLFALAVGLALWKPGLFTVVPEGRVQVTACLFFLVMGPAAVIGLRAFLDVKLLDWIEPLATAVPVASFIGGLIWLADRNLRSRAMVLFFAPILFFGSWGGLVLSNARLDRAPSWIVPVEVVDHDRGEKPSLTITLPDVHGRARKTLRARRETVEASIAGGSVCAVISPGRFGWRSLYVVGCRVNVP